MNPTNTQLLAFVAENNIQPSIIDEVDSNTTFVGYCLPNCHAESEKKWLVKVIRKIGSKQVIGFANASRKFDVAWSERATYDYYISTDVEYQGNMAYRYMKISM